MALDSERVVSQISNLFRAALSDKNFDVSQTFKEAEEIATNQIVRQVLFTKEPGRNASPTEQAILTNHLRFLKEQVKHYPPLPSDEFPQVSAKHWEDLLLFMSEDSEVGLSERISILAAFEIEDRLPQANLRSPRTATALQNFASRSLQQLVKSFASSEVQDNQRKDLDSPTGAATKVVDQKEPTSKDEKDKPLPQPSQVDDPQGLALQPAVQLDEGISVWQLVIRLKVFEPNLLRRIVSFQVWAGLTDEIDLHKTRLPEFLVLWLSRMLHRANRIELDIFVELLTAYMGELDRNVLREVTDARIPSGPFQGRSLLAACLLVPSNRAFAYKLLAILAFAVWEKERELPDDVSPQMARDFLLEQPPLKVNAINEGRLELIRRSFDWNARSIQDLQ